ncbi:MAG: ElyC/SanA/YdcF family protein, partial [Bacteroidota bacterium]|nr:ElyC/SanA/YdcF family protein [Bacteroidota bacterium]
MYKQSIPGIIIILGSPNSEEGELYQVAKQRCETGIQEFLNHPSWKIMLTGGFGEHFNKSEKPHAFYLQKYLIERGIAPEAIIDSVLSTNTLEDASLSKPKIVKYNVNELVVVTSDFHYERARYIFEHAYSDTNIRIRFSLSDTDENTCGFDIKSQKAHEKNSLRKLKGNIAMNEHIKTGFRYILFTIALGLMSLMSCEQRSAESTKIRGVYGNPKPFWERDLNLKDLGVNAVFIHSGSINHDILNRARSEGLMVFAEFATLNGKNYVEQHPEAWAINEKGEKVQAASWFMGVCPTDPGFRKYRSDQLRNLLSEYELDGVWLDYVHWHAQFEEPEPILPETCFCDHCLETFSEDTKIKLPDGTTSEKAQWILKNQDNLWRDWRCKVVYNWTVEMKSVMKEIEPEALLGLYHCPWDDL